MLPAKTLCFFVACCAAMAAAEFHRAKVQDIIIPSYKHKHHTKDYYYAHHSLKGDYRANAIEDDRQDHKAGHRPVHRVHYSDQHRAHYPDHRDHPVHRELPYPKQHPKPHPIHRELPPKNHPVHRGVSTHPTSDHRPSRLSNEHKRDHQLSPPPVVHHGRWTFFDKPGHKTNKHHAAYPHHYGHHH